MQIVGAAHETPVAGTSIPWGEMDAGPPLLLLHGAHRTSLLLAPHRTPTRVRPPTRGTRIRELFGPRQRG